MTKIILAPGRKTESLRALLDQLYPPFSAGQKVGLKLHWGERGNKTFLRPHYAREICRWLIDKGVHPYVFDTTVLYSGGRRSGQDALETAIQHGYSEAFLGCPVIIADGFDGRDIVDIPAGFKHFASVQVAALIKNTDGFVIFSHFKGHMAAGFGGAVKNIAMGIASRAQKQRMHSDVYPELEGEKCNACGLCVEVCPSGAARIDASGRPTYERESCLGCAQCIALCPQMALRIFWEDDLEEFQEKIVETAAAVWKIMQGRTLVINALLNISAECDCLPGRHPLIAEDYGFVGGYHPVAVDKKSLQMLGSLPFEKAHPGTQFQRQFSYAQKIGFYEPPAPV